MWNDLQGAISTNPDVTSAKHHFMAFESIDKKQRLAWDVPASTIVSVFARIRKTFFAAQSGIHSTLDNHGLFFSILTAVVDSLSNWHAETIASDIEWTGIISLFVENLWFMNWAVREVPMCIGTPHLSTTPNRMNTPKSPKPKNNRIIPHTVIWSSHTDVGQRLVSDLLFCYQAESRMDVHIILCPSSL